MKLLDKRPKLSKTVMTIIGTILVGIAPVLVAKYPEVALVMSTIGGLLGGGAHIKQPGPPAA